MASASRGAAELSDDVLGDFMAVADSLLGRELRVGQALPAQFNEEASVDTIRHYAFGVADLNPLWSNEEYSLGARFGAIVAPPTFPYSVSLPSVAMFQDELIRFSRDRNVLWAVLYGGTAWEFRQPIVAGSRLHATARLTGAKLKKSRTAGRLIVLTGEVRYWSQQDELVAQATCDQIRYLSSQAEPDRTAGLQGRDGPRINNAASLPSPEELAELAGRRGPVPLYWDEVNAGDSLPDVHKGIFRMTDMIRWIGGTYGPPMTSAIDGPQGETGSPGAGNPATEHLEPALAAASGLPGPYDNGPLRGGWLSQVVTDWCGDWGDLMRLDYRLSMLNIVGDTNIAKGAVRAKRPGTDAGSGTVEVDVWIENDWGHHSAYGSAIVRLPLRD
jgi:acyl dehydratase